jgi:CBS domain-containing protein
MRTADRQAGSPRTAADLMNRDVVTVSPEASARELARVLWRNGISGAPVVEAGRLVGLVSGKDVLWLGERMGADAGRVAFEDWNGLDHVRVRDLMTPDVFGVPPTADVDALRRFFSTAGVQRAPVLDGGRLVGIISISDVLAAIAQGGRRDDA